MVVYLTVMLWGRVQGERVTKVTCAACGVCIAGGSVESAPTLTHPGAIHASSAVRWTH